MLVKSCPYCGAPMENVRRVQCGALECTRRLNNDRQKRFQAEYRARTGASYRARYGRGSRGTAEGKRRRDRKYRSKRRAQLREAVVDDVRPEDIFDRDGWRCGICGRKVHRALRAPHPRSASLDHIVPLSAGGAHVAENLQCSHLGCNVRKRHTGPGQLRLIG